MGLATPRTDARWGRVAPLSPSGPNRHFRQDTRFFINAIVWAAKTGVCQRNLPERFGGWKIAYSRFYGWAIKGHWSAPSGDCLSAWSRRQRSLLTAFMSMLTKTRRMDRMGKKSAHGRGCGGITTKTHAAANLRGNPFFLAILLICVDDDRGDNLFSNALTPKPA